MDRDGGKRAMPIGWVFEKRAKYTDCDEMYMQETWVTVHAHAPEREVRVTEHLFDLDRRVEA
jgi:hypothetical protein